MPKNPKKKPPPPPKKKDDAPPVEEGLPMWMATFADLVTLLLCFFVLLLSFANQDVQKFRSLMGSIQDAFGVQVERPDADYAAMAESKYERKDMQLKEEDKAVLGMSVQLQELLKEDEDLKKTIKVMPQAQGVLMRVPNDFLFEDGSIKLKPESQRVIKKVITVLKEHNFDLVIRGHTDDTPIVSDVFPSNWELSSSRAAATLRAILNAGDIKSTRLKAVGYADSQPLVPNTSDDNRALNRRTEFYFHRQGSSSW